MGLEAVLRWGRGDYEGVAGKREPKWSKSTNRLNRLNYYRQSVSITCVDLHLYGVSLDASDGGGTDFGQHAPLLWSSDKESAMRIFSGLRTAGLQKDDIHLLSSDEESVISELHRFGE